VLLRWGFFLMPAIWPATPAQPSYAFEIEVTDGDIVIALPLAHFRAVYYKPARQPQLILRERKCDDWELITQAHQAAVKTARELGWIA
jgi:hypothetical protein